MVRTAVVGICTAGALALILGSQVLFNFNLHKDATVSHRLEDVERRLHYLEAASAKWLPLLNESRSLLQSEGSSGALLARSSSFEHHAHSMPSNLEASIKPLADAPPHACHPELSDLTSLEMMYKGGWIFDMHNADFRRGYLVGWKDGMQLGHLSVKMPASGQFLLHVQNNHPIVLDSNVLTIKLNSEQVSFITGGQQKLLCLMVKTGDELTISEVYGKIALLTAELRCGARVDVSMLKPTVFMHCSIAKGHVVWVPTSKCERDRKQGTVDRILNATRVVVAMGREPDMWWQLFDATQVSLTSDAASRCESFPFNRAPGVGIILVVDSNFAKKYGPLIQTQKCYAAARNYDHVILDPWQYNACNHYDDIFFRKHCIIATWLDSQPEGYVAAVVDADVVGVALERGLEEWYQHESDVHVYERDWNTEIMAGCYMVRNTAHARRFLLGWSDFNFHKPIGYCSSDNGAIHLHMLNVLQLEGAERCQNLWDNLRSDVSNMTEYFAYVHCCKQLLGRPRTWHVEGGWKLTVWPRMSFWVVDGSSLDYVASDSAGHVMLHGVKNASEVAARFYSSLAQCAPDYTRTVRYRGELTRRLLLFANAGVDLPELPPDSVLFPPGSGCVQCVERCMRNYTCRPLRNDEADGLPLPRRTCKACKSS